MFAPRKKEIENDHALIWIISEAIGKNRSQSV